MMNFILNKIKNPYIRSKLLKSKFNPMITVDLKPTNPLISDSKPLKENPKYTDIYLNRLPCGVSKYDHIESNCKKPEQIVNC